MFYGLCESYSGPLIFVLTNLFSVTNNELKHVKAYQNDVSRRRSNKFRK